MKKIITTIICIAMLCLGLTGCVDTNSNVKVKLAEVTRSVFYAPLYIADKNGYFNEEGIDLEVVTSNGANLVMTALITKAADIGLMGPEATIYCHVEKQENYPVIFGQLTKRDGSFLVGRNAEPDFSWASLAGKRVLAGRAGGVPAMTLQYVMNQAGIYHGQNGTNIDTTVEFGSMIGAFEGDKSINYCTMFEPAASDFIAAGKGHIVASVGQQGGEVPYTSFSASKDFLANKRDIATKFLRAVTKGYQYMLTNSIDDVAIVLQKTFNTNTVEQLKAATQSYIDIDAWSTSPIMTKNAFDKLQEIMENAGYLDARVDWAKAVDNSIAYEVLGK